MEAGGRGGGRKGGGRKGGEEERRGGRRGGRGGEENRPVTQCTNVLRSSRGERVVLE